MSIYQEQMMRKLPKLGCTGTLDEAYRIREYVNLYERSPKMPIPEVSQYRKFSEYGDTVLAGAYPVAK